MGIQKTPPVFNKLKKIEYIYVSIYIFYFLLYLGSVYTVYAYTPQVSQVLGLIISTFLFSAWESGPNLFTDCLMIDQQSDL